ncbi:MAG TPA: hypothetical protein VMJ10_36915 [Kofleriaceae bacterium]|nr:hypothetical protein [Kofleriaceae bacterium]
MSDDEPVPKLPRGRGLKLSKPELFKIALTAAILVAVVALAHPCGEAVSGFVMRFDNNQNAGSAMPKPGTVDMPQHYEHLTPGMTDEQQKAAVQREIERAKRSGSDSGSGSGSN